MDLAGDLEKFVGEELPFSSVGRRSETRQAGVVDGTKVSRPSPDAKPRTPPSDLRATPQSSNPASSKRKRKRKRKRRLSDRLQAPHTLDGV